MSVYAEAADGTALCLTCAPGDGLRLGADDPDPVLAHERTVHDRDWTDPGYELTVPRPADWDLPATCPVAHPWGPGRVIRGWMPCDGGDPHPADPQSRGHVWVKSAPQVEDCDEVYYRPAHHAAE